MHTEADIRAVIATLAAFQEQDRARIEAEAEALSPEALSDAMLDTMLQDNLGQDALSAAS